MIRNYDNTTRMRGGFPRVTKLGAVSPCGESTPFVFRDRLYRLELCDATRGVDPAAPVCALIRDRETGEVLSRLAQDCYYHSLYQEGDTTFVLGTRSAGGSRAGDTIRIFESRDLVHWRIVSYIYDLLEDDAIYNLQDGKNAYGAGQWATSLRYHEGVFYALFVSNDQHKSYMYRTRDVVNGPWERTVFEDYFFHDPGLLFDGDRLFVVYGNGDLRLAELSADGETWTEAAYALPMQYTLDFFTGYRSGLYCMGSAGTAAFDYFRQWVY